MRIQRRLDPNNSRRFIAPASCVLLVVLAWGWLITLSPTQAEVSEPAGFIRLTVPGESTRMVSMPFGPCDPTLNGVFSNQLRGAAEEAAADRILHWDRLMQAYRASFKADNTGNPERDGFWFESGTNWTPATRTIEPGIGFWIENRHSDQHVFLCGVLLLDPVHSESLLPGLNAFGYPFPASVPLGETTFAADGAQGGVGILEADWVVCPETQSTNWLFQSVGHAWHNQWLDSTGSLSETMLMQGRGYWYQRLPTNGFAWSVPRPFAVDAFSDSSNTPRILSIVPSPQLDAVELKLACTGQDGELIEIFFQDIEAEGSFDSAGEWRLAAEGMATLGETNLVWQDADGVQRLPVTSVFSRVYVVSRQDFDGDGDGLSDGREVLIHGTDPLLFDSDGDGLSDAEELEVHGTDPLLFDSDGDGMGDGSELRWGFCPTTTTAYATLPWEEDFESLALGSVHEQNEWFAAPSESAIVQTSMVKNGLQALELGATAGGVVLRHYYGAAGTEQVWIGMWLRPVPGSLPDMAGNAADRAAVVAVNEAGFLCGWDGIASQWVVLTNVPPVSGEWTPLTVLLDYRTRKWSLYVGDLLCFADLGFADNTLCEFSRAQWTGSSGLLPSYLDDIGVTDTEPLQLDDDQDGMPNYWERLYGLDVDRDDSAEDPDGDGLTNLEEYLLGTNPMLADTSGDGMLDGTKLRWGQNPAVSNAYAFVPWSADFESEEDYSLGDLNGQNGWNVLLGLGLIQTNHANSGQRSAMLMRSIGSIAHMEKLFVGGSECILWSRFAIRMTPGPLVPLDASSSHQSVLIAMDHRMRLCGYDGVLKNWVMASNVAASKPCKWLTVDVKTDYAAKKWSLYLDGKPILAQLHFADSSIERPSRVALVGGNSQGDFIDNISFSYMAPESLDEDNDGIPNHLEATHETDPFDPDTDNDGMDDGRELDWGFYPLISNNYARLPWTANFETGEGYQADILDGQQDWFADLSVSVQTSAVAFGAQAVEIQPVDGQGAAMARYFGAHGEPVVWFEVYARLRPGALPDPNSFPNTHAALFAVNEHGRVCAFDSRLNQWRISAPEHGIESEEWARIVIRLDYRYREWSLYVHNVRVFHKVPFLHSSIRALSKAQIIIPTASAVTKSVFVDAMAVQTVEPAMLDNDGDGMPNAWEIMYGLNPESAADKWTDLDGDGLSNYEEYLYGTDPGNADTDGDGVNDYSELFLALTDPTEPDFSGTAETVFSINGSAFTNKVGKWFAQGSEAVCKGARGVLEYAMEIPEPGCYRIEVEGYGEYMRAAKLLACLDGLYLGANLLPVETDKQDNVTHFFTPWLLGGSHSLRVEWDNVYSIRQLHISMIRVQRMGGVDADQNGRADWIDGRLQQQCALDTPSATSLVSPYCIEGKDWYPELMSITGSVPVHQGVRRRWYANLPLSPSNPVTATVSFQNGAFVTNLSVTWEDFNILQQDDILLRQADTLLLSAYPMSGSEGANTIMINGYPVFAGSSTSRYPYSFNQPGSYVLEGVYDDGGGVVLSGAVTVCVVSNAFPEQIAAMRGRERTLACPDISFQNAVLEADALLCITDRALLGSDGTQIKLGMADSDDAHYLVARLGAGGPIMASAKLDTFWMRSVVDGSYYSVGALSDGSQIVENRVIASGLPEYVDIRQAFYIGGVTFEDGTISRIIRRADFSEEGECIYRVIVSPGGNSPCHYMEAWQDDRFLGKPW